MALYTINKGKEENLPSAINEGSLYFCIDTGNLFVDHKDVSDVLVRTKISGKYAEKLRYLKNETTIEINPDVIELNTNKVTTLDDTATDIQYPSAKAVKDAISNASIVTVEITGAGTDSDPYASSMTFDEIKSAMQAGRTVVGIKPSSNPAFFIACISFSSLITFTRLAVLNIMNDDVICESYTIFKDGHITHKNSRLEDTANKVTSLSADSTDRQYPSAKAVKDAITNIQATLDNKAPLVHTHDWLQNDSTAADYIANRPGGYDEENGVINITWDGNITDKTVVYLNPDNTFGVCKVSDKILTQEDVIGGSISVMAKNKEGNYESIIVIDSITQTDIGAMSDVIFTVREDIIFISAPTTFEGMTFPEAGIYFIFSNTEGDEYYVSSLTKTGVITPHQFEDKYIPDTVVRKTDVIDNLTSTDTNMPLSANQGKILKEFMENNYLDKEFIKNNYLDKANAVEYTPTEDYHPATKKYVDRIAKHLVFDDNDNIIGIMMRDPTNGYDYTLRMENGVLISTCTLVAIEVTSNPTKMTYSDGDHIDTTGMVVSAIYEDGSTRPITNYTCTNAVTTSDPVFTISISDEISTTLPVTVNEFDPAVVLIDFEYTDNGDGTYTITDWKETYNGEPSTEMIVPNNAYIIL